MRGDTVPPEAPMHSPTLRIALLFALAIGLSVAATWAKAHLAADHPHATRLLTGGSP